ncbi:hypothetical protein SAMN02910292_00700 [Lachnospiraceae bacterium XBB2008]|nr:hypothetical protein SAMN02910292_00700 [Lachnospiraceae bacterium XBB2008]
MDQSIQWLFNLIEKELVISHYVADNFLISYIGKILESAGDCNESETDIIVSELRRVAKSARGGARIFILSAAFNLRNDPDIFIDLLDSVWEDRELLGANTVNYLFKQLKYLAFSNPSVNNQFIFAKEAYISQWIISKYAEVFTDILSPIPYSERDHDVVIVLTEQQLGPKHSPSIISADRCSILINRLHKTVVLINSAEALSLNGLIPFVNANKANYRNELLDTNSLEWNGTVIPYYQCDNNMPNIDSLKELLLTIRDLRPIYIVAIGGGGVLTGLADMIIPSVCNGLAASDLSISGCSYQLYPGKTDDKYKFELQALGLNDNSIIYTRYGFSLSPQEEHHTRSEIGISDDSFVLVIIGNRLNSEITSEFWNMISIVIDRCPKIEIMIIGNYSVSESSIPQDIIRHLHVLGHVEDVLSYIELSNLFINPKRLGGGTTAVCAMSKGIPIVTTEFGDIATNAGESFWVNEYEDYPNVIDRYRTDTEFYSSQSKKALERASELLNAEDDFVYAIKEFEKRIQKE